MPLNQDQRLIGDHGRTSVIKAASALHVGTKKLVSAVCNELLSTVTLSVKRRKMHWYSQKKGCGAPWVITCEPDLDFITSNITGFSFPHSTSWTVLTHWNNIKDILSWSETYWERNTYKKRHVLFHNGCTVSSKHLIWYIFVMHIFNESQLSLSKKNIFVIASPGMTGSNSNLCWILSSTLLTENYRPPSVPFHLLYHLQWK